MDKEEAKRILLERSSVLLSNKIVVDMLKGYKTKKERTEVLLLATLYTIFKECETSKS